MTSYAISDPAKPWVILFSSPRLDAVAEALAAQPAGDLSTVYATLDGKPRSLNDAEELELTRSLAALRANSSNLAEPDPSGSTRDA